MKTYNFNNAEEFKSLEKQAYNGTIDIQNFPATEYKYFDMLCKIYYDFKHNGLSQDTAEKYKRILLAEYKSNIGEKEKLRKVYAEYQENIKKAELLMSEIEKSQDAQTIALKACEVIQLLTGEMSFLERQKKKIQNKIKEEN